MLINPENVMVAPNSEGGEKPTREAEGHGPNPPTQLALASWDGRATVWAGLCPSALPTGFFPDRPVS